MGLFKDMPPISWTNHILMMQVPQLYFITVAELIDALMHLMLQSHKDNGGQLQHCQTCNEPRAINFQSWWLLLREKKEKDGNHVCDDSQSVAWMTECSMLEIICKHSQGLVSPRQTAIVWWEVASHHVTHTLLLKVWNTPNHWTTSWSGHLLTILSSNVKKKCIATTDLS